MKKVLLTAVAVSMLFAAPFTSYATEQDVAKITCKEFLGDKDNMPMMLMWIDGYMSGKSDNTVISDAWMEKTRHASGNILRQESWQNYYGRYGSHAR